MAAAGISEGMRVADIGAGTGFFTWPAARRVGPRGHVYAVDQAPEMLEELRRKLAAAPEPAIEVLQSLETRIPIPDGSVDVAFLACVLHELDGAGSLLECRRILRAGGTLAVVDWKKIDQDEGPPVEHRLSEGDAERVLRESGFEVVRRFASGPFHYGLEATVRGP